MNWVYKKTWLGWQVTIPALGTLPIKIADTDIQETVEAQVKKILDLHKQLNDLETDSDTQKALNIEIKAIDDDIDKTVFEIYGISTEQQQLTRL